MAILGGIVRPPQRGYEPPKLGYMTVRGKHASSYEYNVGAALDYYKLEFLFQVDYWGGRRFRGGIVVDFLVFTKPLPTPIWVQGEYWHSGSRAAIDRLQMAIVEQMGNTARPLAWYGEDCATYELALHTVRKELVF